LRNVVKYDYILTAIVLYRLSEFNIMFFGLQ